MQRRTVFVGSLLALAVSLSQGADESHAVATRSGGQVPPVQPSSALPPEKVAETAGPARPSVHGHTRPSLDDRIKALAKSLNLNEAQQAAVKKIIEQRQQETLRLRLDPSIAGSDRIDRLRAIQDQTADRIRLVLNEEQRQKYNPVTPRKLPPAPDQRSVEDWIQTTTQN